MSSKLDNTLLLPGTEGWNVWRGNPESGYECTLKSDSAKAYDLDKISAQRLIMGFPIREVLCVPFHVQTEDAEMFADLAEMHLEKSGIRPEEDAGVLTDVFVAEKGNGSAQLLSVVLSAPAADSMPVTSPNSFDISARFFPLKENSVTLWCELGRWGFAITSGDKLSYFQALSCKKLGNEVVRDIRLALMQLNTQGVQLKLEYPIVWVSGDAMDPSDDEIRAIEIGLGASVSVVSKPAPIVPSELSKLVPADVRAEQKRKAETMKRNILIAAALCVYLGIAGYLAYGYFGIKSDLAAQSEELEAIKIEHTGIQFFNDDWDQLSAVVDNERWVLTLLKRCASLIPAGQDLRFKLFDATPERITIRGESDDIGITSSYAEKLKNSLSEYSWSMPPATADAKTNRWKFNYEGTLKGLSE